MFFPCIILGSSFQYDYLRERIHNVRDTWPQCVGNESGIDNCTYINNMNTSYCYPVLVKCDLSSSNSALAAAVSVPLLLLVGAGICVIIVTVFAYRRWKRKENRCIYKYKCHVYLYLCIFKRLGINTTVM